MDKPEALMFPELLETVPQDAYLNIQHETEPEVRIIPVGRYCHNAAAELRRLHAENEKFRKHIESQNEELDKLMPMAERLEAENERLKTVPMKYRRMEFNAQLQMENDNLHAQRGALLEALKWIADHDLLDTDLTIAGHMAHGFIGRARAAVSAFEGEKT